MQTLIPRRTTRVFAPCSRPNRRLNVLIVDDLPEERRHLAEMLLEACGAETRIRECDSGLAALDILRRERIELVLIDYMLPDMDGLELVSEIADMADDTAVILLGGSGTERIAAQAIKHGARDYLLKRDLTQAALQSAIIEALRTARLEWRHVQMVQQLRNTNERLSQFARNMSRQVRDSLRGLEESFHRLKEACPPAPHMLGRLAEFEKHLNRSRMVLEGLSAMEAIDDEM